MMGRDESRLPAAAPRPHRGNQHASRHVHVLKDHRCLKKVPDILVREAGFEPCAVFGGVSTDDAEAYWSFFQI